MDPAAIRPPRSSDFRDRVRPAAQQTVATDLTPARTVTASATASAARQAATDDAAGNEPPALAPVLDPAGRAMLDARAKKDELGSERNGSALLRFRAYTRPRVSAAKDPDTDLQL